MLYISFMHLLVEAQELIGRTYANLAVCGARIMGRHAQATPPRLSFFAAVFRTSSLSSLTCREGPCIFSSLRRFRNLALEHFSLLHSFLARGHSFVRQGRSIVD